MEITEYKKREQDLQTDETTGLTIKKAAYKEFNDYIKQAIENGEEFSTIISDADFFKRVNDTYGHNAGDLVLVHTADIMQKCVGKYGRVFRWGGEEFIILLPNYNLKQTAELAENIRYTIEQSTCISDNIMIHLTMSFGVKQLELEKTLEENIKEVDDKLYKAKQTGRNKVIQ